MSSRLIVPAMAVALLAGLAVAVTRVVPWSTASADAPGTPTAPQPPTAAGALLLTIHIDHRGVDVVHATRKPGLAWRRTRDDAELGYRWRILDDSGATLAEGGFDPARLCLDPTHAGLPPHVEGDVPMPHETHVNVKVPDLADAARIEFARRDGANDVPFGAVRIAAMEVR